MADICDKLLTHTSSALARARVEFQEGKAIGQSEKYFS
jgi:hypothetical protein